LDRYFRSKDELLVALALHEKERFASELAAAVDGLTGAERLDRTIRFMVEFQRDYPMRGLVVVEPAFTLDQLERARREMTRVLVPLLDETFPAGGSPAGASPAPRVADLADLIVRITMSHFLIRGDDAQLLRELRHVAGLDAR
jgi:AcrR family transcriptional regulator